ncbi:O-antigen ligase family protein [Zobellia nedashkovskayae]|uniref:O-antigen ligase family protein n=1 Tax=Zobellia nedashkovskayae TaxID=2779510 RepID=UPI00188B1A5C|nr:O-antigen ligase family protein [Zobellia nedashkovskayae]
MLQYIIAFIGIIIFGYFIVIKPTIETYVLFVAYGLCLIDTKILPMEYGLLRFFDVVSIVALILFFKEFINFTSNGKGRIYLILVILFWLFIILGKINSQFPLNNLQFTYQPFTIFIYARFVMLYLEKKKDNLYKFVQAFQLSIIAMVLVVFIQVVVGVQFSYMSGSSSNVFNESTGITRYPGLFLDSQTSGQFLALGSFSFLIFQPNSSTRKKQLYYIAFAFSVLAILLAGSRSALGGWLVGMVIVFFSMSARIKSTIILLAVMLFTTLTLLSPEGGGIFSRTDTISSDFLFRKSIWDETGDIIAQYPILGIGLANFQKYIKMYHQDLYLITEAGGDLYYLNQPENGYLKILVEHGYIGFFIFVILICLPLLSCFKKIYNGYQAKEMIYPVAAILSWGIAFNTVYSLIDYRMLLAVATYICLCIYSSKSTYVWTKNYIN